MVPGESVLNKVLYGEVPPRGPGPYPFLLYRHECFAGIYTTRKIHKNYIRDPSGLFSIISHVSLSMT